MSMFTAFNISASGMTAQQLRTDVISQNIANVNTTRTSDGTPYVRKAVVFTDTDSFNRRDRLKLKRFIFCQRVKTGTQWIVRRWCKGNFCL